MQILVALVYAHCRTVCEQDKSWSKLASMAGSLLLPLVGRVAGKAADVVVEGVTRMWGVDGERGKLERQLLAVQSLLVDAEAQSETKPAIKRWTPPAALSVGGTRRFGQMLGSGRTILPLGSRCCSAM